MQTWCGLGRLGKDPEVKTTSGGAKMAMFSLAIDEYNHSAKKRETTWLNVVCFGRTAEFVVRNFHRGDPIFISNGRVAVNQWVDNDGNKRTSYNIVANQVDFVPRGKGGGQGSGQGGQNRQKPNTEPDIDWGNNEEEDPWAE